MHGFIYENALLIVAASLGKTAFNQALKFHEVPWQAKS